MGRDKRLSSLEASLTESSLPKPDAPAEKPPAAKPARKKAAAKPAKTEDINAELRGKAPATPAAVKSKADEPVAEERHGKSWDDPFS